jgi:hypothetical protein
MRGDLQEFMTSTQRQPPLYSYSILIKEEEEKEGRIRNHYSTVYDDQIAK